MSDTELVLRRKCEHGYFKHHSYGNRTGNWTWKGCPGGSEVVLDPAELAKVIHDLQDEHGLETRHDIGLALIDALEDT